MSCNWDEYNLNRVTSINWRASLVPAAAVIPAPIAYIKIVAVKTLVVGYLLRIAGPSLVVRTRCVLGIFLGNVFALHCVAHDPELLL